MNRLAQVQSNIIHYQWDTEIQHNAGARDGPRHTPRALKCYEIMQPKEIYEESKRPQ